MYWYWWIVIVIAATTLLLGIVGSLVPTSPEVEARLAARRAAREERLRPWVPEHLRCEAEVDGGRCRNQWAERVGNEQVCTDHAETYRLYEGR